MTGPLMQLFARLQTMPKAEQYAALQRMADDGSPIVLDGPPDAGWLDQQVPQRQPVDEYVSRRPMAFRDPQQAGPSPSTGPLSSLYGGQVAHGNIDIFNRPTVHNRDGSASSVRSMSFSEGGPEILVPTVSENARIMGDEEAIDQYRRTGRHLGKFSTPEAATTFAGRLHDQQEALGDARALSGGDMGPEARRARRLTSQRRPMGPLSALLEGKR